MEVANVTFSRRDESLMKDLKNFLAKEGISYSWEYVDFGFSIMVHIDNEPVIKIESFVAPRKSAVEIVWDNKEVQEALTKIRLRKLCESL